MEIQTSKVEKNKPGSITPCFDVSFSGIGELRLPSCILSWAISIGQDSGDSFQKSGLFFM